MARLIKLQGHAPDSCDGARTNQGCQFIEMWSPDDDPTTRTITPVHAVRTCSGHRDITPANVMLWDDGNWKPMRLYMAYQRVWFRKRDHDNWRAKGAAWRAANPGIPDYEDLTILDENGAPYHTERYFNNPHCDAAMPDQMRRFSRVPQTPGSVDPPPQDEIDGLARVYGWAKRDNVRAADISSLFAAEGFPPESDDVEIVWTGHGNDRTANVSLRRGTLTPAQRSRIQSALDIQHGPNVVSVA